MNPFLSPIEKPRGLMMKLAYYFTRRQFGKVLTPVKAHAVRLPAAFGLFYAKVGRLDKKLTLPPKTVLLIRQQVARLNICLFCIDIGRAFAIKEMIKEAKFDALGQYRTNALFTDAERAALDYATELTRDKKVNPDTFARMAPPLFRAGDLRNLLVSCERASLQHAQHRSEHPRGYAL